MTYYTDLKKKIRRTIIGTAFNISEVKSTQLAYFLIFKRKINLENPKDFNEKIQWLKLFWQDPLVLQGADKYRVREILQKNNLEEILIPLYGVYSNADEIDWDRLPQKFIIKTNNASGTNLIVQDKSTINKSKIIKQLNRWIKINFSYHALEPQYQSIVPKIIVEKLLEDNGNLIDYRFFCFNGEPKFLYVSVDGEFDENGVSDKIVRKIYLDFEWNELPYGNENLKKLDKLPTKPSNLDEMLSIAKKLSRDIPFVRVDLYNLNGKIYFGEMTFTPSSGFANYYSKETLITLGDLLELPKVKKFGYK